VFSSKTELKNAINACLKLPTGDCSDGPDGAIGEWDISRVTDMSRMFSDANSFHGDISKWGVSSVTDMNCMFFQAAAFGCDLARWDVSSVTNMHGMEEHAVHVGNA
jgi:surface protein